MLELEGQIKNITISNKTLLCLAQQFCSDNFIGKIEQKRQCCVGNITLCSSASASTKDDVQVRVGGAFFPRLIAPN